jgi:hypothetical protein
MKTKNLYVLVSNNGDGSFSTQYTFDDELLGKLEEAHDNGLMDSENGVGCDGDGFHYDTLTVPAECTADSLGISVLDDDFADQFSD